MFLSLNDRTGFSDRMNTYRDIISYDKYPKQNANYIGKACTLRYMNESLRTATTKNGEAMNGVNNRFYINKGNYPNYKGINQGAPNVFYIVRFDTVTPFRFIAIDRLSKNVIVTTTDKILSLVDLYNEDGSPADFVYKSNSLVPPGYASVSFGKTTDQLSFFANYEKEKIHKILVQDDETLNHLVYTEYKTDISQPRSFINKDADKVNDWSWNKEKLEEVKATHPEIKYMDESILKSFEQFYCLHGKSTIDNPKRAKNYGFLIRSDVNGNDACDVVMELIPKSGHMYLRYVTDQEAKIYYDNSVAVSSSAHITEMMYSMGIDVRTDMGE